MYIYTYDSESQKDNENADYSAKIEDIRSRQICSLYHSIEPPLGIILNVSIVR
jgi:hypothetical protein